MGCVLHRVACENSDGMGDGTQLFLEETGGVGWALFHSRAEEMTFLKIS